MKDPKDNVDDEQNFNESELEDIMNEIEILEQDFEEDSVVVEEVELTTSNKPSEVVSIKKEKTRDKGSMNGSQFQFDVSGDMKLQMNFLIQGENIHLSVDDEGFTVNVDNGMHFTLPLKDLKKVG
jgi:hypothetical protein